MGVVKRHAESLAYNEEFEDLKRRLHEEDGFEVTINMEAFRGLRQPPALCPHNEEQFEDLKRRLLEDDDFGDRISMAECDLLGQMLDAKIILLKQKIRRIEQAEKEKQERRNIEAFRRVRQKIRDEKAASHQSHCSEMRKP